MTAATPTAGKTNRLSEDWLATIIGLLIVLIVGSGLLGPGAQNVSINAPAGETASAAVRPLSGWKVSATIGDAQTSAAGAPTAFTSGQNTVIACRDGALTTEPSAALPDGVNAPPDGRAQVVVLNECDAPVKVTYTTRAAIPWPLFNLFSR
jgi:hypothetical protein